MAFSTTRGELTPSSVKVQTPTNYVSHFDFSNQFIPDTYDDLASRYGNQSITGLLAMQGSEMGFSADKTVWAEEGRLHTMYTDVSRSGAVFTKVGHVFRVNETVNISDTALNVRGIITAATADTFTVQTFKIAGLTGLATSALKVFVDGSEFNKGTAGMSGSLEKDVEILENKPIILKDVYEVTGSDATNIGWIKTANGYFWFLESEDETRQRWEDRLELAMLLGEKADAGSTAETAGYTGTEGLFEAMRNRSNLFSGAATTLTDMDNIVKQFDKEGKIGDYTWYCDRAQSLAIDDLLGTLNAGYSGGVSYGIFQNKEQAIDLGFRSFKRGTYNFHKSDYKLLNDPTLLGGIAEAAGKIRGMLLPMGTKEVYDGAGRSSDKIRVPYLHVKYKVGPNGESRKYKTWVLGTVGNVKTNDNDNMEVHHLSERLLCFVGANNGVLFEGS